MIPKYKIGDKVYRVNIENFRSKRNDYLSTHGCIISYQRFVINSWRQTRLQSSWLTNKSIKSIDNGAGIFLHEDTEYLEYRLADDNCENAIDDISEKDLDLFFGKTLKEAKEKISKFIKKEMATLSE